LRNTTNALFRLHDAIQKTKDIDKNVYKELIKYYTEYLEALIQEYEAENDDGK